MKVRLDHLFEYDDSPAPPVPAGPPDVPVAQRYQDDEERVSVLDASAELEDLTGLALGKVREILNEPIDWDNTRMVNAQLSAATTVLNTQVRVDEGRLRKRKLDILPKLLDLIAKEEGKLAPKMLEMALQD